MGRVITDEKLEAIIYQLERDRDNLGLNLGKLVIEGNVPVESIAQLMQVSEPTIYRWMYGTSKPSKVYHESLEKVLKILRGGKRDKVIPMKGLKEDRVAKFVEIVKDYRAKLSRAE